MFPTMLKNNWIIEMSWYQPIKFMYSAAGCIWRLSCNKGIKSSKAQSNVQLLNFFCSTAHFFDNAITVSFSDISCLKVKHIYCGENVAWWDWFAFGPRYDEENFGQGHDYLFHKLLYSKPHLIASLKEYRQLR